MTSPALTLARLKARQAALSREASRHPMLEQAPYREREAEVMRMVAEAVVADKQTGRTDG